jgi:ribulose-5-phosphate 4-epimerase/fuculose-1-phosphate aldolase
MSSNYEEKINEFVQACHRISGYDLQRCSSGNLSYRLDEKTVALSSSGTWFEDITSGQVAICELDSGKCINGLRPSIESAFHLGILRKKPEINAVLHFQSPYATAIACGNPAEYDFSIIIEVPFYIGQPAIIEFIKPGSQELANAVISAMDDHKLAILRNHGLVTIGKDLRDAIQKAYFFELACQILLTRSSLKPLSKEAFNMLVEMTRV